MDREPLHDELNRIIDMFGLANTLECLKDLVDHVASEMPDEDVQASLEHVASRLEAACVDAEDAGY